MTQKINHGEVWLANLNPSRGKEPGKVRPVLILQDQALLDAMHPTTIIIPLTTRLIDNVSPFRVRVEPSGHLDKTSDLLIDQLRAIDNKRLIDGPLCKMEQNKLVEIYRAVNEILGISLNQSVEVDTSELID